MFLSKNNASVNNSLQSLLFRFYKQITIGIGYEFSITIFAAVKDKLVKIFAYLLLLAVSAETVSDFFIKNDVSVVLMDNEESNNSKKVDPEKKDLSEKYCQIYSLQLSTKGQCPFYVLSNTYYKNSAYLSLPEIPPDQV